MHVTGLHLVLTYRCIFECGHCFIWGSSRRSGVFQLEQLDAVLDQAAALGTISELCYEGGETFVYYPILIAAVRHAAARRLRTTVVTNGYWANSVEQARLWLGRLADAGLERIRFIADGRKGSGAAGAHPGVVAAEQLGLVTSVMGSGERGSGGHASTGQAGWPSRCSRQELEQPAESAPRLPWETFTACPYAELISPSHLHVDPFGDLHLCRGLVIGNVFEYPLAELVDSYAPEEHAIIGPLLAGGPAGLVSRYGLQPHPGYADACQLCDHSRALLQSRFPTMNRRVMV